jgi:branched-chain amino acid transport system permease protein
MVKTLNISLIDVIIVSVTLLLLLLLNLLIYHTRFGMAMRAVSFNTDYAALMGIPIDRVISITFVLGAVLAAAAGFLYGQKFSLQQTASYAWILLGLRAFIAAVIGGIGNVRGAVLGGFLIAFIDAFGSFYGTYFFENANSYSDVLMFSLLILVLLIKPSGILGKTTREKV